MKHSFVSLLMCCAMVGCASHATPPPDPPTVEVVKPAPDAPPVEVKRTDLPPNWVEVKGDTWSYGLPADFNPIATGGNLAAHKSVSQDVSITLETDTTNNHDLVGYVSIWAAAMSLASGKEVIHTAQKVSDEITILAVQLLWTTGIDQYASSLDFFTEKNNVVYHVSCSSDDAAKLKASGQTCFDIMDTFRLK
jgi:hypothetical protein